MRSDGRGHEWIVLLEVASGPGCGTIDPTALERLVTACGTPAPTTLFSPDRYALQLEVRAPDPPAALSAAIARWRVALQRAAVPPWDLVRAELLTPEELESELREAEALPAHHLIGREDPSMSVGIDPVEEALLRSALFDSVTGLPARELFLEEVRWSLASPPPPPAVRAVILVHVDLAGEEERPSGQPPPDEVLAGLARRLTASVRDGDTVARVGASDFALFVELPAADGTDLVVRRLLDRIGAPPPDGQPGPQVASVGVAMACAGSDADDLLERAGLVLTAAARKPRRAESPGAPLYDAS